LNEPVLWMLSINAFAAVLLLLSLLGGAIWLLTFVFRAPEPAAVAAAVAAAAPSGAAASSDAATVVAIHAAVHQLWPDARVVRIEDER